MAQEKGKEKAEAGQRIDCDRLRCEHNHGGRCEARRVRYRNKLCRTYSRLDGAEMMKAPFKANCHKRSGKYTSDGAGVF